MPQKAYLHILLLLFMVQGFIAPKVMGEESASVSPVMILISQDIKPYLEAFTGMRDYFDEKGIRIFKLFYQDLTLMSLDDIRNYLSENRIQDCIAIGPEAVGYLFRELDTLKINKVYTMIFDMKSVVPGLENACGVPLKMPPKSQLKAIKTHLPKAKRIGVMYDPTHNSDFIEEATLSAGEAGVLIVRMEVASEKEIAAVLKKNIRSIDAIWLIPDLTVISEKIVPYIIKEAMGNGIPVVGYNRFFLESGAALSFILDYREIGKQTALLTHEQMQGKVCGTTPSFFRTLLNARLLDKLGVTSVKPGHE